MKRKKSYRRITDSWKRILCSMLVLAMILSSVSTTGTVYAAEMPNETVVDSTEENLTETTSVDSTESTEENLEVAAEELETGVEADDLKTTEVVSPEVNGKSVTFRYVNSSIPEESVVYVKGSMNNWGNENPMTKGDDGVYTCTIDELTEGTYQYKFYYDDGSEYGFWTTDPSNGNEADGNSVFIIGETLVSPEINGNSVTFRYRNTNLDETTKVYVRGSFNDWGTTNEMIEGEGDIYTCTLELDNGDYTYKFWYNDGTEHWLTDPSNPEKSGDNSFFNIGGPIETGIISPEIDGNKVTFRYNQGGEAVYLAGSMTEWDTNKILMTKEDPESNVFSHTMTLEPGYYTYKFVVDGSWINDPSNTNKEDTNDANNYFVVPGLYNASLTVKKGVATALPQTLQMIAEGETTPVDVTPVYTLKTEGVEEYVTLTDSTITVSGEYEGDVIELTATAEDLTSTVTLNLVDKEFIYTIYTHSYVDSRMDEENSVLYVWDEAKETVAEPADYAFTEKVELDGKTWLKTVVKVPYAQRLGMIFREKEATAADGTQWACPSLFYSNTEEAEETTLYLVDGQSKVFTDLEDVEYTKERYLIIEYTRDDGEYDNANIYSWSTDWGTVHYMFEEPVNGKAIVKIPVLPSAIDKKINFIVKKDIPWDDEAGNSNKDGGDNFFMMPADQDIVKIRFYDGKITGTLPYNMGSKMNKEEGKLSFFYRDDALFVDGLMESLKDKVELVVKSSPANEEIDGTYPMTYDAENERFYYDVPLTDNTDYYYYFM